MYSSAEQKVHVPHSTNGDRAMHCNYGAFALLLHFVHTGDVCTQRIDKYFVLSSCTVHTFIYTTIHTYTHSRHSPEDTGRNERERNKKKNALAGTPMTNIQTVGC